MQELSAKLSIIFHCDKSDLEINKKDTLDTQKEFYNINPCQMCSINFDNEDWNYHKNPHKKRKIPNNQHSFEGNYSWYGTLEHCSKLVSYLVTVHHLKIETDFKTEIDICKILM